MLYAGYKCKITHIMPYLSSTVGIIRSTSSFLAVALPLVTIFGRLGFGWLGDRLDTKRLMATGLFLQFLGLCFLFYVSTAGLWLLVLLLIIFSIGWGGVVPMMPAVVREYFGRTNLGTILGLIMGVTTIGTVTGPPLAGWIFDSFNSYQSAWFVLSGIAVAGVVSLLTTPSVSATRQKIYT
jgi:MFS family permease